MPTIPSNTSHARSFPAISRSFIFKPHPGFVGVISLARNFFGNYKRQIVGPSASFTGSQPPPTDASTQPRNSGSSTTNSFAVVGSCAASFRSVLQSQNACFDAEKYSHRNIRGFTCSILLIGVINFFLVGTTVAACRIFPISFSVRLNGTPFVMRTIL